MEPKGPKHLTPTLFQRPDRIKEPLHVITMVSNPIRFRSRWKLYQDFAWHVRDRGGILYTAEVRFGNRDFSITEAGNPYHLQLETSSEIWHKENALNLLLARLPLDWKYVAWLDADITFARPDIFNETLHQLQHYSIVQMWSEAQDLDPQHQVIQKHRSFMHCHIHNAKEENYCSTYPYKQGRDRVVYWHPGFAWAARREAISDLEGLLDFCVLGSADHHMANALVGNVESTLISGLHPRYKQQIRKWERLADKHIKKNVGYVPGLLLHHWHGPKIDRKYKDRWKILTETGFDPDRDITYDWQGLLKLTDDNLKFRDRTRAYFRARNEDDAPVDAIWSQTMERE